MDNSSRIGNRGQKIAGVRLVYGNPPSSAQDPLEAMDYCTRLVMQLKEEEILQGLDFLQNPEQYDLDDLELVFVDDEEDIE